MRFHNELFSTKFSRVIFYLPSAHFNAYTSYIDKLKIAYPEIEIQTDIPKLADLRSDHLPKLFILDDLMAQIFGNSSMEEVFSQNSHHYNFSIVFTSQNFFSSSKNLTIVRQTTYKIIFNDLSDQVPVS